jgi:hypothetical protein
MLTNMSEDKQRPATFEEAFTDIEPHHRGLPGGHIDGMASGAASQSITLSQAPLGGSLQPISFAFQMCILRYCSRLSPDANNMLNKDIRRVKWAKVGTFVCG